MFLRSLLVATFLVAPAAHAAEQVLFEIPLDINRSGDLDRAMMVIVGEKLDIKEAVPVEFHALEDGQRADLLIFLDVGADPLNITDPHAIRVEGIARDDGLRFILPPLATAKGSLNVITSNGYGNTFNTTETLTVVWRKGRFLVAGWAQDFYSSREEQSTHCSINYLTGKTTVRNINGKTTNMVTRLLPPLLTEWDSRKRPKFCDDLL
jgi:hypothetical protein